MTDKIVDFPVKLPQPPDIKKGVCVMDVENIGFLTRDDRDIWIKNKKDIVKIMRFIIDQKITLMEGKKNPPER